MKNYLRTGLLSLSCVLLTTLSAQAELKTHDLDYMHEGKPMQGYLVYDPDKLKPGKNPALLVYHAWMGIGEPEKEWSNRLAEQGYIVFAPDIYGKGIRPTDPKQAGEQATIYRKDRKLMRARAQAGLKQLQNHPRVDASKIGALGFCFGGGVALELARSGADVKGVVSLHGNLDTPDPADAKNIKGQVLVLHGAADPHVPMEQVAAFQQEMHAAKVDWQLDMYGGAVHAFTDLRAGSDPSKGAAYDASAAGKAWDATVQFFGKLFA